MTADTKHGALGDYLLQRAMLARLDNCRVPPFERDKNGNIIPSSWTAQDDFRERVQFKELFGFDPTQEYVDKFFGRRSE